MYKLLKERGNNVNLTLENTETKASIMLGRLSMDILDILKTEEGIRFGDAPDETELKAQWEFNIKDETAKELSAIAFKMSKPIRDQRKAKEEPKKNNKQIDAMDVLLGLANYN